MRHCPVRSASLVTLALLTAASASRAQLANASAAATAMAGTYTVMARNFNAVAWNPANLGLPGNSSFSLALLPIGATLGAGPVTPSLIAKEGCGVGLLDLIRLKIGDPCTVLLTDAVKREWVSMINNQGGQTLAGDMGVTWAALNIGRIGVHVSTGVFATGKLSPALAEVMLFGNAGYDNGTPKDYVLSGSTIDASVLTTLGLSYAQSMSLKLGPLPDQTFSVGATAKYILGNGLITGIESGGTLDADPLAVRLDFPMVHSDTANAVNGTGLAFDIGAAWQGGPFRAGMVVRNAFSTFAWNTSNWSYRPFRVVMTADSTEASSEAQPYSAAPANLRNRVKNLTLEPTLAIGGAFTGFGPLTLSGEFRQQLGDGLKLSARTHLGAGAELRLIRFLPIRAGFASVTGGSRMGGGIGLEFGVINLQLAGAVSKVDGADEGGLGLTLSFGGR